ncbi:MAG: hypothetical protein NTY48_07080 [Candidatus Diapherotrites archaeon]|nr:hypothetical protein [Candidatus Diapherotrites archaeon]
MVKADVKGKWSSDNMLTEFKLLESYPVSSDGVLAEVRVIERKKSFVKEYFLSLSEFGEGTEALIRDLKNSIIAESSIKADALLDQKFVDELKDKFRKRADQLISIELPSVSETTKNELIGALLHEMLGLGRIEMILADGNLEEIVVNKSKEPVWVYHKKYGWLKTNIYISSEEDIHNYGSIIARRVGKQITTLDPLLDAHLTTGDRVNATLFPISNDVFGKRWSLSLILFFRAGLLLEKQLFWVFVFPLSSPITVF